VKKTIIHVAQDAIRRNAKLGTDEPAIIVRRGNKATRHGEIKLMHKGEVVGVFHYQPRNPLPCGARVWLELGKDVIAFEEEDEKPCETCGGTQLIQADPYNFGTPVRCGDCT
jgi:hypothetical protein